MLHRLKSIIKQRDWKLFTAPYELNIVGVRSPITRAGAFDDLITVFYRDQNRKWHFHAWPATTDPGLPYLHLPINDLGAAILAEGQYLDVYRIDKHRGQYDALCQRNGTVTVIRDHNRDSILDWNNGIEVEGLFGINIHRALKVGQTLMVERHSAGCQVFAHADHYEQFFKLCRLHERLHGNQFTYSLVDFRRMRKANRRKWLLRGALLGGTALVAMLTFSGIAREEEESEIITTIN